MRPPKLPPLLVALFIVGGMFASLGLGLLVTASVREAAFFTLYFLGSAFLCPHDVDRDASAS